MDTADIADRNAEIISRANCHKSHKPEPKGQANGNCWQCAKPVQPGWRWCNATCRDNWQTDNDTESKRNGRRNR